MYNDLTGNFPFMSLDGSVCFLVMYHYEANAIFAIPIVGLDDVTIFEAYEKKFNKLEKPGHKAHQEVPHQRTVQIAIGRAPQPQNERRQTSKPNLEGRIHRRACYHQSRLTNPAVGQDCASGLRQSEFAPSITN